MWRATHSRACSARLPHALATGRMRLCLCCESRSIPESSSRGNNSTHCVVFSAVEHMNWQSHGRCKLPAVSCQRGGHCGSAHWPMGSSQQIRQVFAAVNSAPAVSFPDVNRTAHSCYSSAPLCNVSSQSHDPIAENYHPVHDSARQRTLVVSHLYCSVPKILDHGYVRRTTVLTAFIVLQHNAS